MTIRHWLFSSAWPQSSSWASVLSSPHEAQTQTPNARLLTWNPAWSSHAGGISPAHACECHPSSTVPHTRTLCTTVQRQANSMIYRCRDSGQSDQDSSVRNIFLADRRSHFTPKDELTTSANLRWMDVTFRVNSVLVETLVLIQALLSFEK